jgi:zinc protease
MRQFLPLLLLAGAAPAADIDPALVKAASAPLAAVQQHTLPNGLRVYLLPVPSAPVVTTMVAYKVGACDEAKGQTGLSHYLEHLLFKGTDKLMPGDVDRLTQVNGGRNNAYTSEDMTVYHFDFAADRWQESLKIEAERMRGTRIDDRHEFQQEKGAVVAELKGNEDRPWDLEYKAVLPLLYATADPYSHPVIGQEGHVRGATAEVIRRYYDLWYHPNNASLVVVGGFDPAAALKRITELFGPIPRAELPARRPAPAGPRRTAQVRAEIPSKFEVARLVAGFNTVLAGHQDEAALDVLAEVLASGKTSRLYKRLVDGERVASGVSAYGNGGRYPGWLGVQVELLQGKDRPAAEGLVFEELAKLASEPVTPAELARVKRAAVARTVFAREDVHSLCDEIARAVTTTSLDDLRGELDRLLAVTPADVQRVAKQYLAKQSAAVVWSVPTSDKGGKPATPAPPPDRRLLRSADAAPAGGVKLTDAVRTVLPNGLTLVALPLRRLPIVAAEAFVADVRLREPADMNGVAALVGDLLEEGTPTRTGDQIAALIEDTGGSLSLRSGGGSLKVLTPDADLGLSLLLDCLANPAMPAEAVDRKREQQLSAIAEAETTPQVRARQLFAKTVYGDHPFGRPGAGTKAVVGKLTAADCKAFHAAAYGPDVTTLVVVGDFDPAELRAKVEKLTAGWKPAKRGPVAPPAPPAADKPSLTIVPDKSAAQTHVFVGHLGVKRSDPDFYTLLVMDNVLGTGPGFTDRLSATLRDRQGLAYTVTAQVAGSASDQPGAFTGYIGTFPDKFLWVKDGFLKEVARIRDEPATEAEVDAAKRYLLGSLAFRLATADDIAGQLLAAERYKLGYDFLDTYRAKVGAVTPALVQAAARRHLDPNRLAVVAVGPVGPDGKPLAP